MKEIQQPVAAGQLTGHWLTSLLILLHFLYISESVKK